MPADVRTLTARWVFPASSPPLEVGTVTIRGEKIEAVEPRGVRPADDDLGNVALIPGLVNAHTHLDLSGARGLIPPTDPDHFTDWLKGVIAFRRSRSEEQTLADIDAGLVECLRYGTTLIGDIASEGRSWDALVVAKTRAVVFREVIGLGYDWQDRYFDAHAWLNTRVNMLNCRKALSPHAPYSVRAMLFSLLISRCENDGLPAAFHLAESPAETELVEERRGGFIPFLTQIGFNDFAKLVGNLSDLPGKQPTTAPRLFIHCNYLPINALLAPVHSIVYCPRTHAAFGHPPHPFREFLARGVRVCLGTDSLASNPDLDILAEARFVHAKYPDFPGEQLLKMVTLSGAEALGWADECGSLEPGKSADLVAVPLPDADGDPHELLFGTGVAGEMRRTMCRGEWR